MLIESALWGRAPADPSASPSSIISAPTVTSGADGSNCHSALNWEPNSPDGTSRCADAPSRVAHFGPRPSRVPPEGGRMGWSAALKRPLAWASHPLSVATTRRTRRSAGRGSSSTGSNGAWNGPARGAQAAPPARRRLGARCHEAGRPARGRPVGDHPDRGPPDGALGSHLVERPGVVGPDGQGPRVLGGGRDQGRGRRAADPVDPRAATASTGGAAGRPRNRRRPFPPTRRRPRRPRPSRRRPRPGSRLPRPRSRRSRPSPRPGVRRRRRQPGAATASTDRGADRRRPAGGRCGRGPSGGPDRGRRRGTRARARAEPEPTERRRARGGGARGRAARAGRATGAGSSRHAAAESPPAETPPAAALGQGAPAEPVTHGRATAASRA